MTDFAGFGNSPTNDPAQRRASGDEGSAGVNATSRPTDGAGGNRYDNVNREGFDAKYEATVAADGNQPTPKRGPSGMHVPSID